MAAGGIGCRQVTNRPTNKPAGTELAGEILV